MPVELDLMLQGFFNSHYDSLRAQERAAFQTLLSYPDQVLMEYLMGQITPVDPIVADVANKIRHAAAD